MSRQLAKALPDSAVLLRCQADVLEALRWQIYHALMHESSV